MKKFKRFVREFMPMDTDKPHEAIAKGFIVALFFGMLGILLFR